MSLIGLCHRLYLEMRLSLQFAGRVLGRTAVLGPREPQPQAAATEVAAEAAACSSDLVRMLALTQGAERDSLLTPVGLASEAQENPDPGSCPR